MTALDKAQRDRGTVSRADVQRLVLKLHGYLDEEGRKAVLSDLREINARVVS